MFEKCYVSPFFSQLSPRITVLDYLFSLQLKEGILALLSANFMFIINVIIIIIIIIIVIIINAFNVV